MLYRVPQEWIARKRRNARAAPLILVGAAIAVLGAVLLPRLNWSRPQDRTSAFIATVVVIVGFGLGGLAGRFSFQNTMNNWETFDIELTDTELIRHLRGQEVRIQRANVTSLREYPRGIMVTDNLGWRIYIPKFVDNYAEFRQRILSWSNKS